MGDYITDYLLGTRASALVLGENPRKNYWWYREGSNERLPTRCYLSNQSAAFTVYPKQRLKRHLYSTATAYPVVLFFIWGLQTAGFDREAGNVDEVSPRNNGARNQDAKDLSFKS